MPKHAKGTTKLENGTNRYTLCFVTLSENGIKNIPHAKKPENAKECQRD